jgi:hypothetical protein
MLNNYNLKSDKNILNNFPLKVYCGVATSLLEGLLAQVSRPILKSNINMFVKVTGSNNNVFLIVCDEFSRNVVYSTSLYSNNFTKNKKLYNYFVEKFGRYFSWRLQDIKFSGFHWKYYFHRLSVQYTGAFVPSLGRYVEDLDNLSCAISVRVAFNGIKQSKRGKLYNKFV